MKQDDTKRLILKKALELFSTKGYDSVSVAEIAKAVGIKAPSLYNHYESKQAIFDAIVKDTAEQYDKFTSGINVHVGNAKEDKDVFSDITERALKEKVRSIFVYSLHDGQISSFRKMLTIEQFRTRELSELYSKRFVKRMTDYHAEIFRGLIGAGVIEKHDPETLALMYVSPILVLLGVCDRQPEREKECLEKLDAHVGLFFGTFNTKKRQQIIKNSRKD